MARIVSATQTKVDDALSALEQARAELSEATASLPAYNASDLVSLADRLGRVHRAMARYNEASKVYATTMTEVARSAVDALTRMGSL